MTNVYVMVHCATVALRTLHGPLPLPAVVAIKQTLEIFFTLILGAANVTAFLQVVLILKPRWVQVCSDYAILASPACCSRRQMKRS